ncbi:hypothetical protein FS837_000774 [Tulasnella sp. UAMH 9824]|nr:hypothetical protein FS837_000774 [Tulasnella sp. UAMH 9824]
MPDTLVPTLKKEPRLHTISFGEGGAYFYKKMPTENSAAEYLVSAATAINYPKVRSVFNSDEIINWVAFGPDGAYVIDTPGALIASDPAMTRNYTRDGKSTIVPLRCASFGPRGVWVVVEDDGEVRSRGLPQNVLDALSKKGVRRIELNPFSADGFFVEYTDGTTTWRLPTTWHTQVEDTQKLNIQMDEPAEIKKDLSKNIIFTFGPKPDVYCISHQGHTAWKGIPEKLSSRLREPGSPSAVSLGEGEAFFWKKGTQYSVSSEAELAYPEVWKIWKSDEAINWVTFGPEGYYIVDTPKRIYASRQNVMVRTYTNSGNQVSIRCAAFGWGGSWVIVEDDGVVRSHGLESNHVALSWTNPNHFYIEYTDQATKWRLPSGWHSKIYEVEGKLKRLEKLPHGGGDFDKILAQFNTTWRDTGKNCPTIKHIYKIVLLDSIWDQYNQYL